MYNVFQYKFYHASYKYQNHFFRNDLISLVRITFGDYDEFRCKGIY